MQATAVNGKLKSDSDQQSQQAGDANRKDCDLLGS